MDADVVVVGADPTGLMLATELRLRGVSTIVVEELDARSAFGKAMNIQPRTAEILDLRGLLERARGFAEGRIEGSHFWGVPLRYDVLDTRYPFQLRVPQARLEEVLEERLIELGASVRWRPQQHPQAARHCFSGDGREGVLHHGRHPLGCGHQGSTPDRRDVEALLVRPDGHVCWAAPGEPVDAALRAWFGSPDRTVHATSKALA